MWSVCFEQPHGEEFCNILKWHEHYVCAMGDSRWRVHAPGGSALQACQSTLLMCSYAHTNELKQHPVCSDALWDGQVGQLLAVHSCNKLHFGGLKQILQEYSSCLFPLPVQVCCQANYKTKTICVTLPWSWFILMLTYMASSFYMLEVSIDSHGFSTRRNSSTCTSIELNQNKKILAKTVLSIELKQTEKYWQKQFSFLFVDNFVSTVCFYEIQY